MAQSKKTSKKTTAKPANKSSAPKRKSTSKPQELNPPEPVVPIRRELGAVLFFFLALFTGIGLYPHLSVKSNREADIARIVYKIYDFSR